jgi:AraC-like DNA-binding protein
LSNWMAPFRMLRNYSWIQKRFYRQSLVLVLLAICVPTILVGSGVKWFGTRQMEEIVLSSRHHQVTQSAARVQDTLSYLERSASQWAFNADFGFKLKSLETQYDYELIRSIYTNLLLLKESSPLIDQAYIYLDQQGIVHSDSRGTLTLHEEEKARFHALLGYPHTTYWLSAFQPAAGLGVDQGMLTLVYQLPADSGVEPFGALLVYLKRSQVSQLLSGSTLDENGAAFLFDEEGRSIGGSSESGRTAQLQNGLMERIRSHGSDKGSLVFDEGGDAYSVTYAVFKRLGKYWTYATVDSLEKINSPVIAASHFVYMFGGAGLLLAIITAFFVSRKLYQPLHSLIKMFRAHPAHEEEAADEVEFITRQWNHLNFKSLALEQRLQRQLPAMKEGFLLQLLQGHFQFTGPDQLKERMQHFGWDTEGTGFLVFGIQLTGSVQSKVRFQEGDQELIAFAAVNIAEELLSEAGMMSEIINLHDLSVSVIIGYSLEEPFAAKRKEMLLLAERLVGALHSFLQMQVTLCISRPVVTVTEIAEAWDQVTRAVRFRDLNDPKQVIMAEDFMLQTNDSIRYPFAAESEVIEALRNMDERQVHEALDKFCRELQANTKREYLFEQGLLQLHGNLRFHMLKSGYNPFESETIRLQEELERGIDTSAIAGLFLDRLILPYLQRLKQDSENQDIKLKLTIERIVEAIHEGYGDPDLSVDGMADEHGLTPLTLSKLFKKMTGTNFITYLTDVRLRKSKQLLSDTDDKINDIAEMVGYQPTYFNRIFKKSEGVTPSQYRELVTKETK